MVPRGRVHSYYGKPVINEPVWESPDIAGYLFLGGLAGASSTLAAGAAAHRPPAGPRGQDRARSGPIGLSAVALVHDLGRPARFLNMLRVFKPTSPMSVGSWLLAAYGPAAGAAAACARDRPAAAGRAPRPPRRRAARAGVASYTAALIADTAVPAWHEGHREMPFVFVGSAASAAAGLGLLAVRPRRAGPAVRFAVLGAAAELTAKSLLLRRLGTPRGALPGGGGWAR